MRVFTAVGVVAVMLVVGPARADEPKAEAPAKPHEWLKQLAGEWTTEAEAVMGPGQPPVKFKGTESIKSLGGFWSVSEVNCMGPAVTGVMTLGYDPEKGKYVGTWVCSMEPRLWKYEGTVEGNKLTLNTEGPHMVTGKTVKMRDVIEVKGKDEKVLTSEMLGDDGKWTTFMTMTAKRKK